MTTPTGLSFATLLDWLEGLREPDQIVDCGNSGTGIRLLAGVLAGVLLLAPSRKPGVQTLRKRQSSLAFSAEREG